jgi:hypothetical protein
MVMSNTAITIIVAVVILVILITAAGVTVPLLSLRKKKKKAELLLATGSKGEATVLQLDETGEMVNANPRINVLLDVRIPGFPPYQVRKTVTIPRVRLSQIQVGSVVAVVADPNQPANPDKVGILIR